MEKLKEVLSILKQLALEILYTFLIVIGVMLLMSGLSNNLPKSPPAPVVQTQCIVDYKVSYSHNDIPNWDNPPEDFCVEKGEFAVPTSIAMLSMGFGKKKTSNNENWFYVTWNCYSSCQSKNRLLK